MLFSAGCGTGFSAGSKGGLRSEGGVLSTSDLRCISYTELDPNVLGSLLFCLRLDGDGDETSARPLEPVEMVPHSKAARPAAFPREGGFKAQQRLRACSAARQGGVGRKHEQRPKHMAVIQAAPVSEMHISSQGEMHSGN